MNNDIIAAIATGTGGAMAVIRVSGTGAMAAVDVIFHGRTALTTAPGGRFLYGNIVDSGESRPPSDTNIDERLSEGERSETVEPTTSRAACANVVCTNARVAKEEENQSASVASLSHNIIDDVVVSIFRAPHSYTGEDVVEISCHGSRYIQNRIMQLLAAQGVRPAAAGEFTMRALLNGRMALAQAEAVADIIAAENRSAHRVAASQMRGAYSGELATLREELVRTAALLELELDFGEEDVEFADRTELRALVDEVRERLKRLAGSFAVGNAMKNGVPVAIVGQPNVGKSTLLNALLGDDRAMVSSIAGTTRDTLEECVDLGGIRFRFVDTAGVRQSDDPLEQMGIERTHTALARASVVLLVVSASVKSEELGVEEKSPTGGVEPASEASLRQAQLHRWEMELSHQITALRESIELHPDQKVCIVVNKVDAASYPMPAGTTSSTTIKDFKLPAATVDSTPTNGKTEHSNGVAAGDVPGSTFDTPITPNSDNRNTLIAALRGDGLNDLPIIPISALRGDGLDELRAWLISTVDEGSTDEIIVSNTRHFDALTHAAAALDRVAAGLGTSATSDTPTLSKTETLSGTTPLLPPSLDLVTQDLREALHYLGLLTGAITTDELLQTIFSKFCIGK